ncbi:MAG TPA: hypothetical protein VFU07_05100 [Candidatus Lumbricidophila sp.]|nr:hypothetical protein [Candidatus Lumbricidophila sp.]
MKIIMIRQDGLLCPAFVCCACDKVIEPQHPGGVACWSDDSSEVRVFHKGRCDDKSLPLSIEVSNLAEFLRNRHAHSGVELEVARQQQKPAS